MITIDVVVGFGVCFVLVVVSPFFFLFILLALFPEKLLDHKACIDLDDRCEWQTHGTEGWKFHPAVTNYFFLSGLVYVCK